MRCRRAPAAAELVLDGSGAPREDPRRGARGDRWAVSHPGRRSRATRAWRGARASRCAGVCHSDFNAIDGTAETRCPAVLGHEGAGVVEAVGAGDDAGRRRRPRRAVVGAVLRRLRGVPARSPPSLLHRLARDGNRRADGRAVATLARRRAGVPLLVPLDVRGGVCRAREVVCRDPQDVPFDVAGLVGCAVTTGVGAVWRTARVRPGDRVAVIGCGGVGLSALMAAVAIGAEPVIAVDTTPGKLETARSFGAVGGRPLGGLGRSHRRGDPRGVGRRRRLRDRGDGPARGDDGRIPVDARPWSGGADRDPARRRDRDVARALDSPDGTASARLDLRLVAPRARLRARRSRCTAPGRLPLDRLVSHHLPLDEVERGFELMRSGEALRVVLDLNV